MSSQPVRTADALTAERPDAAPHDPAAASRRVLVVLLVAVGVLAPAALYAGRYPQWWEWIAPELTPMTWLQSVVLVLAAASSALVAIVLALAGRPRKESRTWWLLALGWAVLALNERFAAHERIRDGLLAPRGISVPFLPWVAPGDFLMLGVAIVGLAVAPLVWRGLAADRPARRAFALGVGLALVAVGFDSVDPASWSISAERVQQTAEEVVELASGLAFLAAVGLRLLGLLAALAADGGRTAR